MQARTGASTQKSVNKQTKKGICEGVVEGEGQKKTLQRAFGEGGRG